MLLKKNKIIIFSIIFAFIKSLKEGSYIVFPFKAVGLPFLKNIERREKNGLYNSLNFLNDHYNFGIYSPVEIGSPPQDIIAYINFNHNNLSIGDLLQIQNNIYPDYFYNSYMYDKSYSFINITSKNETQKIDSKTFICDEKLYLFSKIKDIEKNKYTCFSNFKFTFEKKIIYNNNSIYGLIIGLKLHDIDYETNFLNQIKNRNIISSYILSFDFTKENEGLLIIGKYPHEYFPEKYNEDNFKLIYSSQPSDAYLTSFVINFDEINSSVNNEKIEIQKSTKGHIFPNMDLIIGVKEYRTFIEKHFFNKYINMSICYKNSSYYEWDIFFVFYCYDDEKFNLKEFPLLNFYIKSENLKFEFTYKDLFKKIDNKYYFSIIFQNFDIGVWCIGKPFYLKYTLVYNGDAKMIGFYENRNLNKNKNRKKLLLELNSFKIFIIILLFIFFLFLVIIISYYLGKKLNLIRKKHANELDDNYEYYSHSMKNRFFKKDINEKNYNENKEKHLELISQIN